MIIGAQKCGTTTLDAMLRTHPSVTGCTPKEPHFFSTCDDWQAEIARYEQSFAKSADSLYFEASTSYTFYPHRNLELWEDIYEYNPKTKFIYLVRPPIDRMTSSYMHNYERGYTDLEFEAALLEIPLLLDITRYASQIKPFIRRFGREQVHICFFEDLVRDPEAFVSTLSRFLGIHPDGFAHVGEMHSNKSVGGNKPHYKYDRFGALLRVVKRFAPALWKKIATDPARAFHEKPVLSPSHQQVILNTLEPEIREVEVLTGRDLSHWRAVPSAGGLSKEGAVNQ